MPRHPDPDLEERILKAADVLWRRGGAGALTMRAVARMAKTNTPAVYRRFKDREDLLRGLVRRIAMRLRLEFEACPTIEAMAEAYVNYALREPHDYELFYSHLSKIEPRRKPGKAAAIRESRPNFGFLEARLAKRFGGVADDYTPLALAMWSVVHGTASLLLTKAIPEGHEERLRDACRVTVERLIESAQQVQAAR